MNIHAEFDRINQSLSKLRSTEIELRDRRDWIMTQIAMDAIKQPSAAEAIAQALINVHTEHDVWLDTLFGPQSAEVNTAGLLQMAEWRGPETIEMFLNNGADVNACDKDGFSVLEMVIQGHDGYWRGESNHWNKEVFDVLAKYNVRREISHGWIIDQCCDGAPKYVRDFLGV